jgi:hypothetical protein
VSHSCTFGNPTQHLRSLLLIAADYLLQAVIINRFFYTTALRPPSFLPSPTFLYTLLQRQTVALNVV